MEESINATDLRIRTRDIIERAHFRGVRFVIHTFGKPVAIIMGIDEYNALIHSPATAQSRAQDNVLTPLEVPEPNPGSKPG